MCGSTVIDAIRSKYGAKNPILSSGGYSGGGVGGMSITKAMSGAGGRRKRSSSQLPASPILGATDPNNPPTG